MSNLRPFEVERNVFACSALPTGYDLKDMQATK